MPMLQYLHINQMRIQEEWQAYALLAVVVAGIAALIIGIVKVRKW